MPDVEKIASTLRSADMKAINALSRVFFNFSTCRGFVGVSDAMAEVLVSRGLAERGKPEGIFRDGEIGYRLTDLGWRVREARRKRGATP